MEIRALHIPALALSSVWLCFVGFCCVLFCCVLLCLGVRVMLVYSVGKSQGVYESGSLQWIKSKAHD